VTRRTVRPLAYTQARAAHPHGHGAADHDLGRHAYDGEEPHLEERPHGGGKAYVAAVERERRHDDLHDVDSEREGGGTHLIRRVSRQKLPHEEERQWHVDERDEEHATTRHCVGVSGGDVDGKREHPYLRDSQEHSLPARQARKPSNTTAPTKKFEAPTKRSRLIKRAFSRRSAASALATASSWEPSGTWER
jgi:hypothetical protein